MTRPLLYGAVFMMAGVVLASQLPMSATAVLLAALAGAFVVCAALWVKYRQPRVFVLVLFLLAGYLQTARVTAPPSPALEAVLGQQATMTGRVTDTSETATGRQKLRVRLSGVSLAEGSAASGINIPGNIVVEALLDPSERAEIGQDVQLTGTLAALSPSRNPGGFNEFLYLRTRGVSYTTIASLQSKGDMHAGLTAFINGTRARLASVYDRCLPQDESAIMKSIVIGDTSSLSDDTKELYRISGIYHILSISGLHIAVLTMVLNLVLKRLLKPKAAGLVTIATMALYCVLTGLSPSTVRAVLMSGLVIVGRMTERESDTLNSVAFAAVVLLLAQPLYLFDIGFQLSFAATAGLILFSQPFRRLLDMAALRGPLPLRKLATQRLNGPLSSVLAANMTVTPILGYWFYHVYPYSIPVNLILLPTSPLLLVVGVLVGILGLFSITIGQFLSGSLYYLLTFYKDVCSLFTKLPFAEWLTGAWPLWLVCLFFGALALFGGVFSLFGERFDKVKRYPLWGGICFLALFIGFLVWPAPFTFTMLDVGQGDCFVIHKGYTTFVVDGGGTFGRPLGKNTGDLVLTPYLDYLGVSRIDGAFVTHFDVDHATGIWEALRENRIGRVLIANGTATDQTLYEGLISEANRDKIPVVNLDSGDEVAANGIRLQCLWPYAGAAQTKNASSLVLRLSYNGFSFLLTGDIGAEEEAALLAQPEVLDADVLKLAHHGSRYSNTPAFVDAVSPRFCLVSTGLNNAYHHPHPSVMAMLASKDIPVYNTADTGAVVITVNGKSLFTEYIMIHQMLQGALPSS